jgi:hypothetical protein
MSKPTPAQQLTRSIRDLFALKGWLTFKCAAGMVRSERRMIVYGTAGAPDLVAVKGQQYLLVEIKAGHDRLQPSQLTFQAAVAAVKGNYIVARSVEDVLQAVEATP